MTIKKSRKTKNNTHNHLVGREAVETWHGREGAIEGHKEYGKSLKGPKYVEWKTHPGKTGHGYWFDTRFDLEEANESETIVVKLDHRLLAKKLNALLTGIEDTRRKIAQVQSTLTNGLNDERILRTLTVFHEDIVVKAIGDLVYESQLLGILLGIEANGNEYQLAREINWAEITKKQTKD